MSEMGRYSNEPSFAPKSRVIDHRAGGDGHDWIGGCRINVPCSHHARTVTQSTTASHCPLLCSKRDRVSATQSRFIVASKRTARTQSERTVGRRNKRPRRSSSHGNRRCPVMRNRHSPAAFASKASPSHAGHARTTTISNTHAFGVNSASGYFRCRFLRSACLPRIRRVGSYAYGGFDVFCRRC